MTNRPRPKRTGIAFIYVVIAFTALTGFASLAVDFGRVQYDRAQLQLATDAAARYGAAGITGGTWVANAVAAGAGNVIEGQPLQIQTTDVQLGTWVSATSTFYPGNSSPNAVRVSAQLTKARGTAVPTLLAAMLGFTSCDIHATAIAVAQPSQATTVTVSSQADPWLAGMPAGTTANYYSAFGDAAPKNSPVQVPGISITPGAMLNFSFNGNVSYLPGTGTAGCDGNAGWISNNWWAASNGNAEHGIGNVTAPICAVIGVFLNDSQPDSSAAPPALDFSTDASRDFTTLSPLLKQPFFIGDGTRSDGTLQGFIVPPGATRLYVGVMDFEQWSDNTGAVATLISAPPQIVLVQ